LSCAAVGDSELSTIHHIEIPKTSADKALKSLAKQSGVQLLFPFDLVSSLEVEPLIGDYSLMQALAILLQDTGLTGDLTQSGVITISHKDANQTGKGKRMNITKRKTLLATTVALFAGATQVTTAQESAVAQDRGIDEIIVTAQKREQNLQDVGIAVTALDATKLGARGIDNASDLQFSIPALTASITGVGSVRVALRGVGTDNLFPGGDPGVPMHIDGHYIQNTNYIMQDFLDIERVEVLRGPQGTLYGRNAVGGTINLISKRPTNSFEGKMSIDIGNYNKHLLQGIVSGPLSEKLRGRFAFSDQKRDGYIENLSPSGEDLDSLDYISARVSLEYDLTPDIELYLSAYNYENEGNPNAIVLLSENFPNVLPGNIDYYTVNGAGSNISAIDHQKTRQNVGKDLFDDSKGISIDVDWSIKNVEFRSLSSYNKSAAFSVYYIDGSDV
jgi:iron complex outermembrane receptor protein